MYSYGDQGVLIINKWLHSMFPEARLDTPVSTPIPDVVTIPVNASFFKPLTYPEFLSSVLIPYTAILLIQDDLKCDLTSATDTWQLSGS